MKDKKERPNPQKQLAKESFSERKKRIFRQHPKMDSIFVAEDGTIFISSKAAKKKRIKVKEVKRHA